MADTSHVLTQPPAAEPVNIQSFLSLWACIPPGVCLSVPAGSGSVWPWSWTPAVNLHLQPPPAPPSGAAAPREDPESPAARTVYQLAVIRSMCAWENLTPNSRTGGTNKPKPCAERAHTKQGAVCDRRYITLNVSVKGNVSKTAWLMDAKLMIMSTGLRCPRVAGIWAARRGCRHPHRKSTSHLFDLWGWRIWH